MNSVSRFFYGLAILFFAAWVTLQFSPKETGDNIMYETSSGPWAVDGIRLGTNLDECVRKLGQPMRSETNKYNGTIIKEWRTATCEVTISFESASNGKSFEIMGKNLTDRSGKVVIYDSSSEEEVKAVLKSASVKNSYRPSGSGVISCSNVHVGTKFTCKDPDGFYSVNFYEGRISYISASKDINR